MADNEDTPRNGKVRKIVLPTFVLTEVCEATDVGAMHKTFECGSQRFSYFERVRQDESEVCLVGRPLSQRTAFNLYPVVVDSTGLPWYEANIYILSKLESAFNASLSTFDGIADDLAAFRRFIDDEGIDWRKFPVQKLCRPTYRYSNYLRSAISAGSIKTSSAKRRMSAVVAFYNWLSSEGIVTFENAPWRESDVFLKLRDPHGLEVSKRVKTTDVSIRIARQHDPFDGQIDDGGKLRPLSLEEQLWIIETLLEQRNTEMTLAHLIALSTGARIQTVLTMQLRHVRAFDVNSSGLNEFGEIRCPVGAGTGIDTKRDKRMSLHFPVWLCRALRIYAESDRAKARRQVAKGGDNERQYLFLSKYGMPFYRSKDDCKNFDPDNSARQPIKGQSVRKFMAEAVIPKIRLKHDPNFHYQFHDLRASFGMNLTDSQLRLVQNQSRTLSQVREYVKVRMGHESVATTDRYLQFRGNLAHVDAAVDGHDDHLSKLVSKAGLL